MRTAGGRCTVSVNGQNYAARGAMTLSPSSTENTVEANQDGSLYLTVKPRPRTAELTFDRLDLRWDEALLAQKVRVTFIEQDTGYIHMLTDAAFVGHPTISLETGEVTNMSLAFQIYQRVKG
jgi:hypothetical protein